MCNLSLKVIFRSLFDGLGERAEKHSVGLAVPLKVPTAADVFFEHFYL